VTSKISPAVSQALFKRVGVLPLRIAKESRNSSGSTQSGFKLLERQHLESNLRDASLEIA
jgi:hypothetical protein